MMTFSDDLLTFILSFLILCFMLIFLSKLSQKDVFKKRMKDLIHHKQHLDRSAIKTKSLYQHPEEKSSFFKNIILKLQNIGIKEQENLHMLFERAGLRSSHALFFYGLAKILMICLPTAAVGVSLFFFIKLNLLYKVSAILITALLGSYSVDITLDFLINSRRDKIRKDFPIALDLMVICTEAGLSLVATIQRVAREVSQIAPDLGYELALLSIELGMLPDRRKALEHFSNRLDTPQFKAIVTHIIQAEEYGIPIAQTMQTLAEQFRQDRQLEAEERAAKLPAILSLPMMLFIFPCIYIIILGPALLQVIPLLRGIH